jgi:MFS family permease
MTDPDRLNGSSSPGPEIDRSAWLAPGVMGIGAASFLADVGHEVPTALLPRLLTTTLGAPAAALGLIEGIADGLAGVARLVGGALADEPEQRRATAVGGYTSTAVATALIGAAQGVWQVGVLRAAGWAARGLRVPARNALLADAVDSRVYGRAYGFERAMDNLGAIVGPLLAIALVAAFSVRAAILLSVVPGLLAALAIVYAIRRLPRVSSRERQPIRLRFRPVLRGRLGRVLLGVAAFELGNVATTLLILRATELLSSSRGPDQATQLALGLYLTYNVAGTFVSVPAGRLSDAVGAVSVLAGGVATFLAAYVTFALVDDSLAVLAVAFVLAGVGIGCVETAEHSAVATMASADVRGSAFGALAVVQSVGNFAASTIAGIIWTAASPGTAFAYIAAWMAISFVLLLRGGSRSFIAR